MKIKIIDEAREVTPEDWEHIVSVLGLDEKRERALQEVRRLPERFLKGELTMLGDPEKVDWFARWMKGVLYEKEPEKGGW